ncbi:late embryogenesis abundant protein-like [Gossypium australe]|uniref:Late embryogenesis abundant protein-like n=1 Tax=Gossypium australe TaxID=47621 RepID=A0A5B6WKB0_9ROSI|nr:late embryogenesis abundant protein-like [Gossypium australe]
MADLIDENGNPIQLTDEQGNPVQLTDGYGNPIHVIGVATKSPPMHGGDQISVVAAESQQQQQYRPLPLRPEVSSKEEIQSFNSSSTSSFGDGVSEKKGRKDKTKEKLTGRNYEEEEQFHTTTNAAKTSIATTTAAPPRQPYVEQEGMCLREKIKGEIAVVNKNNNIIVALLLNHSCIFVIVMK